MSIPSNLSVNAKTEEDQELELNEGAVRWRTSFRFIILVILVIVDLVGPACCDISLLIRFTKSRSH